MFFTNISIQLCDYTHSSFNVLLSKYWKGEFSHFLHACCQVEIYYLLCRPVRDNSWIIKGEKTVHWAAIRFWKMADFGFMFPASPYVSGSFSSHVSPFSTIFVKTCEVYERIKSATLVQVSTFCLQWWPTTNVSYQSQRFLPEFPRSCWKSSQIQQSYRTNSWTNGPAPSWWQKKATWCDLFLDLGFFIISFFCFCFLILFFLDSGKLLKGKWETENRKY